MDEKPRQPRQDRGRSPRSARTWGEGSKGLSAAYIEQAVEASLKRLQTDVIDLYLSHWPDQSVPYDETLGAYQRLIEKGKIRHAGASNLDAGQLTAALEDRQSQKSLPRYEVLQPEYNLYDRSSFDGPLRDLCIAEEIGVITYFSLAKGFLSGKYRSEADLGKSPRGGGVGKYLNARGFRILAALDAVSARHSAKPAEVALGLDHRAARRHRADRKRHDAAANGKPDPLGVAEAQRVRPGQAGYSQRTVGARITLRCQVP